jgi:rSAM/selenodomain-associated transferase 1
MAMSDKPRQVLGVTRQGEPQATDASGLTPHASRLTPHAALIIFAKAPIPGQVKTRLCPPLTSDEAATLHGSLVLDVLERTQQAVKLVRGKPARLTVDRFLACAPSAAHVFFKILAEREGVRLLTQTGDDLGARMSHAFDAVFGMGYRRVALTGTDLPSIPASVYAEALALLEEHDLVLGPSTDGGYYLIGLKHPVPELWSGVPWSTDRVFDLTMQRAQNLGLDAAVLPSGRDIDTIEDLTALISEAGLWSGQQAQGNKHAASPLSARTAGVLRLLAARLRSRSAGPALGGASPFHPSIIESLMRRPGGLH